MDDIGAGYAGLKQVMRLQPDVLKLDRSLVAGVAADPAKGAMVDALVRYARRIGSEVCAEGVETLEDLQALADLDVTYGQGFVLARPAPAWAVVDARGRGGLHLRPARGDPPRRRRGLDRHHVRVAPRARLPPDRQRCPTAPACARCSTRSGGCSTWTR